MKSKGFSLIEMLIAIVILSISLLALAGLMVTTTKNNSFGSHMTEAATFAQDKFEELRVTQWSLITPNTTTTDQRVGSTGIVYTRSWTAVPNNPAPNDTMKTITVTINWNDGIDHLISHLSAISR
jgi:type IV pilus assembly protein PilV